MSMHLHPEKATGRRVEELCGYFHQSEASLAKLSRQHKLLRLIVFYSFLKWKNWKIYYSTFQSLSASAIETAVFETMRFQMSPVLWDPLESSSKSWVSMNLKTAVWDLSLGPQNQTASKWKRFQTSIRSRLPQWSTTGNTTFSELCNNSTDLLHRVIIRCLIWGYPWLHIVPTQLLSNNHWANILEYFLESPYRQQQGKYWVFKKHHFVSSVSQSWC